VGAEVIISRSAYPNDGLQWLMRRRVREAQVDEARICLRSAEQLELLARAGALNQFKVKSQQFSDPQAEVFRAGEISECRGLGLS